MAKKNRAAAARGRAAKKHARATRAKARTTRVRSRHDEGLVPLPPVGQVPSEDVDVLTAEFTLSFDPIDMPEEEYADWWWDTCEWAVRSVARAAGRAENGDDLLVIAASLFALREQPELGRRDEGLVHPLMVVLAKLGISDTSDTDVEAEP